MTISRNLSFLAQGSNGNVSVVSLSLTGNVTGGNILTGNIISSGGNVLGVNFIGNLSNGASRIHMNNSGNVEIDVGGFGTAVVRVSPLLVSVTGNIISGNASAIGNAVAGNILTAGLISATGNITGGNILTVGIMSSTGNAIHGNILTAGQVSATGSILANNIGNVAALNLNGSSSTVLYGNGVFAAAAGGGVTSLNGQTGAITNTDVDTIGCVMMLYYAANGSGGLNTYITLSTNGTYAGSSLRYNPSNLESRGAGTFLIVKQVTNQNWASGGTALSGTWRSMSSQAWFQKNNAGCCAYDAIWNPVLFVRVS